MKCENRLLNYSSCQIIKLNYRNDAKSDLMEINKLVVFGFSVEAINWTFIFCSNVLSDVKASVYKDFCSQREKKLENCLVADMKVHFFKLKFCTVYFK